MIPRVVNVVLRVHSLKNPWSKNGHIFSSHLISHSVLCLTVSSSFSTRFPRAFSQQEPKRERKILPRERKGIVRETHLSHVLLICFSPSVLLLFLICVLVTHVSFLFRWILTDNLLCYSWTVTFCYPQLLFKILTGSNVIVVRVEVFYDAKDHPHLFCESERIHWRLKSACDVSSLAEDQRQEILYTTHVWFMVFLFWPFVARNGVRDDDKDWKRETCNFVVSILFDTCLEQGSSGQKTLLSFLVSPRFSRVQVRCCWCHRGWWWIDFSCEGERERDHPSLRPSLLLLRLLLSFHPSFSLSSLPETGVGNREGVLWHPTSTWFPPSLLLDSCSLSLCFYSPGMIHDIGEGK